VEHEAPKVTNNRGLGTAARETVSDLSRLARLEGQLLAGRVRAEAARKAAFAGTGLAGAVFLLFGLLLLLFGAVAALDLVLATWASFLIVGGGTVVLGGILGATMAAGFRSGVRPGPAETVEQIKEDVRWVREQKS
jgi:hypothetical protein